MALLGLLGIAVLASLSLWCWLLFRRWVSPGDRAALLPVRRRERPFWGAGDFLVLFGLQLLLLILLQQTFISRGWIVISGADGNKAPDGIGSMVAMMAASSISAVLAMIASLAWLSAGDGRRLKQMDLLPSLEDVSLGLLGALMILPPVLLISAAVSYFQPYHHPVLDSMAQSPTPAMFAAMFLTTAIITPIIEEFTFRVLLQGGLQGIADPEVDEEGDWVPKSNWPIVVTSLFFAGMHFGQGAAYIPLFFLSVGLGYLYRQTGRFAVPVAIHMILNGTTLCVEFWNLST